MKTLIKVCFTALAVLLALLPLLACGGPEEPPPETPAPPPPTAPPTGNQPPVITSINITPETTTVAHGTISRMTCLANDPDGDTLSYSWSATGGTVDVAKQILTWTAPIHDGEFEISVTVDDGKGGTTTKSITITVVTNQRPVITSVTAEPEKIIPGETSTITCVATDADGDTLSYAWSATGGTVSGEGRIVTWQAPEFDGEFVVSVTVDDGKGGMVDGECAIIVGSPVITTIFEPVPSESGSVYFTGDLAADWLVGDNAANSGVRAYFSFDISSLVDAEINEVELSFNTKEIVGNPWSINTFLLVEQVDYGTRPLEGADFHLVKLIELAKFTSSTPGQIDVFLPVTSALRPPAKPRLQVRIRLATDTNANGEDDYISFSGAALNVIYTK
jgi:hypothetical protein